MTLRQVAPRHPSKTLATGLLSFGNIDDRRLHSRSRGKQPTETVAPAAIQWIIGRVTLLGCIEDTVAAPRT